MIRPKKMLPPKAQRILNKTTVFWTCGKVSQDVLHSLRINSPFNHKLVRLNRESAPLYTFKIYKPFSMRIILLFVLLVFASILYGQSKEETSIRQLLLTQTQYWNRGDIDGFMKTYWKNDSLMFIGKTGVHFGWQETLNNYKKSYPDTSAMGKLSFDIADIKKLSSEYYYLVGKWMLKRSIGDLYGYYDLLLKKINGRWYIIADHSS